MSKIALNPGTLLAPVCPALVTCGTMEKPNVLTIAWTGIVSSDPPMTYISVRPERYSYGIVSESKNFAINLPTKDLLFATDFCGVKSGSKVDKIKELGLELAPSQHISAPVLSASPLSLECVVEEIRPLGAHTMFLSRIVGVDVNEEILDESGKIRPGRANLLAYANGDYYALGERLGSMGYSLKK